MKALLIYNGNIASQFVIDFGRELGQTYKFQVGKQELLNTNFTIDEKINRSLNDEIEHVEYDCIFIPYSLSEENYIEFAGLRFAAHIRLTPEFNNVQTPIIFFGYENELEINKLSEIGSILFSRGIYTTKKVSIQDFEKQMQYIVNSHKSIESELFLKQFTKRVVISPSGNYATHHSITNEWSIYRWATALKMEDEQIHKIERKIGSNLYFKYLKARFPNKKVVDAVNQIVTEEGKVLYIDDEVDKGWGLIFRKICSPRKYDSIGSDFKNMDSSSIVQSTIEKIKDFDPDVVILDFRLHDDDFENTEPENVTGYRILDNIKSINRGIQVIILSATNKIWNLLELQKAGADGFILKESPELSVDENYSKNAIGEIYKTINTRLGKKYLKVLFNDIENIKKKDLSSEIRNQLDLFWEMILKAETKDDFAYSYVSLYMIIEIINKEFSECITEECYWDPATKSYQFKPIDRLTEWNKIGFLYFKKWNGQDYKFVQNIYHLIMKRNGFVHSDKDVLDKQDRKGNYPNHDIYNKKGVIRLFSVVKELLNFL